VGGSEGEREGGREGKDVPSIEAAHDILSALAPVVDKDGHITVPGPVIRVLKGIKSDP